MANDDGQSQAAAVARVLNKDEVKVTSATNVKDMTPKEKKALFADLRARMNRSKLQIDKKPPGLHPYWARKADEHEMARLEYLGFKIVHDNPEKRLWDAAGFRQDGTFILGDVILMSLPEIEWEFYQRDIEERSREQAGAAQAEFRDQASQQGVPTFTKDK